MDRNIPHVLDVFQCSPGARRRGYVSEYDSMAPVKGLDKNPGSDSAVSVGSSDASDDDTISRYFDYLNDDDDRRKKKKKTTAKEKNRTTKKEQGKKEGGKEQAKKEGGKEQGKKDGTKEQGKNTEGKNTEGDEHLSRKGEYEKDLRHIERHLSMKKTIRKKMMRDLQQAFVEDPGEFQQDPKSMAPERKNNIDIRNLTFSKSRLSKSEHNFLDMLKDEEKEKEKKGGLFKNSKTRDNARDNVRVNARDSSKDNLKDDDSGNGSPSREPPKENVKEEKEKKVGFWKKLTGKGKSKR